MNAIAPTANDKIKCEIDGQMIHSVQLHIQANYADSWTVDRYKAEYPDAPLLSDFAMQYIQKQQKAAAPAAPAAPAVATATPHEPAVQAEFQQVLPGGGSYTEATEHMHTLFDFGDVPAAKGASGTPITVKVLRDHSAEHMPYLQAVDQGYVFNIDLVKKILVAFTLNKPLLLWGMHGTGKTTAVQQVCARTGRPVMRVQHTINMQESEVIGQWIVKNGQTEYQLGPLAMAMLFGWTYIADEYDFAMPSVTAVYQPVMEGQPLIIKDAPPHLRKITPHRDFRFVATGNTNGQGDETGLYQGTLMQNSANYSRFGVTEEVHYMDEATEQAILRSKAGAPAQNAKQIVSFANKVREAFKDGKISMTISPREMINAAQLGLAFGGNWRMGIDLAFANRLPRTDKIVAGEVAQRIFGS
ncbi:AAA family ATPase [Paracoccus litorisediminis]|uniref:AAA domain-containing protein n=1 Tax=Paracoccus litorisediminis TaxID=2006130 RepID=A0A844HU39_9RHOB|nr:MoxR family ATPase [Paracoccus litorisediminis]MTH61091.1 AAA domain-containing protein [Paracoccus litorisediminis]